MHRLTLKTEISTDIKLKITEMIKFLHTRLKEEFFEGNYIHFV